MRRDRTDLADINLKFGRRRAKLGRAPPQICRFRANRPKFGQFGSLASFGRSRPNISPLRQNYDRQSWSIRGQLWSWPHSVEIGPSLGRFQGQSLRAKFGLGQTLQFRPISPEP